MIFMEILQLDCYAVSELTHPGIPYITVLPVKASSVGNANKIRKKTR